MTTPDEKTVLIVNGVQFYSVPPRSSERRRIVEEAIKKTTWDDTRVRNYFYTHRRELNRLANDNDDEEHPEVETSTGIDVTVYFGEQKRTVSMNQDDVVSNAAEVISFKFITVKCVECVIGLDTIVGELKPPVVLYFTK
jgi:hypothetical protein